MKIASEISPETERYRLRSKRFQWRLILLIGLLATSVAACAGQEQREDDRDMNRYSSDRMSTEVKNGEDGGELDIRSVVERQVKPTVVVELFTSEGCSSCPPAEHLLNLIGENAEEHDFEIYPLAFHVDYWNRLGWRDRFSDARWSERQRDYAEHFSSSTIYTPQMIVNGSTEFIGSNSDRAWKEINASGAKRDEVQIELTLDRERGDASNDVDTERTLSFICRIDSIAEGAELHLLLVESNLESNPDRGENRGRELQHDNVVREMVTYPIMSSEIHGTIRIPEGVVSQHVQLVGMIQERSTMRVIAACRIDASYL